MRRKTSLFFLGIAWFCANGAASYTTQLFAWSQLVVAFAHHLPAAEAFVKQCGDKDLCPVCIAVNRAREDARNHPIPAENLTQAKLQLTCEVAPVAIFPSEREDFATPTNLSAPARAEPVQTGPPRV